jgi:hypothetical protein
MQRAISQRAVVLAAIVFDSSRMVGVLLKMLRANVIVLA